MDSSFTIGIVVSTEPPDNVSLRILNHSELLIEGNQYTLECMVQNVAPVKYLVVTFYKGSTALSQMQSNNTKEVKLVNENFFLNISSSKEDDGVQYHCAAELNLGIDPHPPVISSQRISVTVHCESHTQATHLFLSKRKQDLEHKNAAFPLHSTTGFSSARLGFGVRRLTFKCKSHFSPLISCGGVTTGNGCDDQSETRSSLHQALACPLTLNFRRDGKNSMMNNSVLAFVAESVSILTWACYDYYVVISVNSL